MSALPPKADKEQACRNVRFVPKADIRTAADLLIQSPRRRGRAASGARQLRGRQVQYSSRGGNRAHLIIAHDVTNSGSDRAQLANMDNHRPSASPTTSGGSGQSSVSQMARSSSASRTVTCWFARMQAAQATTIRRLMAGTD